MFMKWNPQQSLRTPTSWQRGLHHTVAGLDQSNFSTGAADAGSARCRRDGAPTSPNLVRVEYYLGCDALQSFIA